MSNIILIIVGVTTFVKSYLFFKDKESILYTVIVSIFISILSVSLSMVFFYFPLLKHIELLYGILIVMVIMLVNFLYKSNTELREKAFRYNIINNLLITLLINSVFGTLLRFLPFLEFYFVILIILVFFGLYYFYQTKTKVLTKWKRNKLYRYPVIILIFMSTILLVSNKEISTTDQTMMSYGDEKVFVSGVSVNRSKDIDLFTEDVRQVYISDNGVYLVKGQESSDRYSQGTVSLEFFSYDTQTVSTIYEVSNMTDLDHFIDMYVDDKEIYINTTEGLFKVNGTTIDELYLHTPSSGDTMYLDYYGALYVNEDGDLTYQTEGSIYQVNSDSLSFAETNNRENYYALSYNGEKVDVVIDDEIYTFYTIFSGNAHSAFVVTNSYIINSVIMNLVDYDEEYSFSYDGTELYQISTDFDRNARITSDTVDMTINSDEELKIPIESDGKVYLLTVQNTSLVEVMVENDITLSRVSFGHLYFNNYFTFGQNSSIFVLLFVFFIPIIKKDEDIDHKLY